MENKRVRRKVTISIDGDDKQAGQLPMPMPMQKERVEDIRLLSLLSQKDREVEARREGLSSIHVTAALSADFCPRREWLIRRYETSAGVNTPFSSQRIIWALGRAAEKHVRDTLLLSMKGNAVGRWGCACGASFVVGRFDASQSCRKCGTPLDSYGEFRASSPTGAVSGSIDFLYQDTGECYGVMEVKSIQKADYENLSGPLIAHVHQCLFYVHLLRGMGATVNRASILYVAKDAVSGSPYKVYDLPLEIPPAVIEAHKDAEVSFQEELPAKRSGCNTPSSPVASKCSQCALCFSVE